MQSCSLANLTDGYDRWMGEKSMKEKQVQIPEWLFYDVIKLVIFEADVDIQKMTDALTEKVNAMVLRELYSKSKTAHTEEEREAARQKYLDEKGIHPDWRW